MIIAHLLYNKLLLSVYTYLVIDIISQTIQAPGTEDKMNFERMWIRMSVDRCAWSLALFFI